MAKLTGLFQYKGKLGQTVGRRNGQKQLSSVSETNMNIVAMAPTAISNPKTAFQATQRMRMRAAVNFYRQIGYILNHSWQGTGYKQPSHNRFMQLALRKGDYAIPFLPKGEQSFVPGEYPISEGGLVGVDVLSISSNALVTGLYGSNAEAQTIGDLATNLINNNAGFYNGDKLTFIFVAERVNDGKAIYNATSVQWILDTASQTAIADADSLPINITVADGRFQFSLKNFGNQGSTIVGGAIINVRAPQLQGGSTAWQRSSSSMFVAESVLTKWMSADAFNAALLSYQADNANTNSDWYLNTGAVNNGGTSGNSSQPQLVSSVVLQTFGPFNGQTVAVFNGKVITQETESSFNFYTPVSGNSVSAGLTTNDMNYVRDFKQNVAGTLEFVTISEAVAAGIVVLSDSPIVDNP